MNHTPEKSGAAEKACVFAGKLCGAVCPKITSGRARADTARAERMDGFRTARHAPNFQAESNQIVLFKPLPVVLLSIREREGDEPHHLGSIFGRSAIHKQPIARLDHFFFPS